MIASQHPLWEGGEFVNLDCLVYSLVTSKWFNQVGKRFFAGAQNDRLDGSASGIMTCK